MAKRIRTDQLSTIGSQAIEKALFGHNVPERGVAVVTGIDGNTVTVRYALVGKRPEDAVVIALARLNRTTGEVISVETFL